uniref:Uncharacterized protein n=1 Tax=Lactuca sativa TaxID=4236 RepID=A0A9R1VL53_LACSA|nr:hypothetical protein LSAT_V11C500289240 [Lactuca sativa]
MLPPKAWTLALLRHHFSSIGRCRHLYVDIGGRRLVLSTTSQSIDQLAGIKQVQKWLETLYSTRMKNLCTELALLKSGQNCKQVDVHSVNN